MGRMGLISGRFWRNAKRFRISRVGKELTQRRRGRRERKVGVGCKGLLTAGSRLRHNSWVRGFSKLLAGKEECAFNLIRTICILILILVSGNAKADPQLNIDNPTEFFTTVASNLLQKQLGVNLTHIQVYPENDYSPAVHRLLQVTANIYDAMTTNFYPTIFRPYFTSDGTNVFISGYEQVDSTNVAPQAPPLTLSDAIQAGLIQTNTTLNIYGIPWILGAKKGLPNFNEATIVGISDMTRRLEATRPLPTPGPVQLNQMIIVGVSNQVGVELWNSYGSNYPRGIQIRIDAAITTTLTNEYGIAITNYFTAGAQTNIAPNTWTGYASFSHASFLVPLLNSFASVPSSVFYQNPPQLIPLTATNAEFETNGDFALPRWGLNIACQRRCVV